MRERENINIIGEKKEIEREREVGEERGSGYQQMRQATLAGSTTGEHDWAQRPMSTGNSDELHEH